LSFELTTKILQLDITEAELKIEGRKKVEAEFNMHATECAAETLRGTWEIVKEMEGLVRTEVTFTTEMMTAEIHQIEAEFKLLAEAEADVLLFQAQCLEKTGGNP